MIEAQNALQNRIVAHSDLLRDSRFYHPLTGTLVHARTLQLMEQTKMLLGEAWEAHDETPWKMHKTEFGREMTAEEIAKCAEELIDAIHFVVNGLILCGLDSAAIIEAAFFEKNAVNHRRQDEGY